MSTASERLRRARERYFESAASAAKAMGIAAGTYAGHENGHRGFPASRAPQYARRFKVTEEWLLYGKGDGPSAIDEPTVDDLERMIAEVIEAELPVPVRIADLPHIVAPALHEQLERFRSDAASRRNKAGQTDLDAGAQSRAATKASSEEESRKP